MNSTGRYKKQNALPYSIILKLNIIETNTAIQLESKIYPILSNNKTTNYQPHFVSKKEMDLIKLNLVEKTPYLEKELTISKDKFGYHFKMKLD